MTLAGNAMEYLERGWSVIPLEAKGKKPLLSWTPYQSRRACPVEINCWWKRWPEANVGIATGQIDGLETFLEISMDGCSVVVSSRERHV